MLKIEYLTSTNTGSTEWRVDDRISLYANIKNAKQLTFGVPLTIRVANTELDYLLEAIRVYENKLAGVADACIYCNNNLHQDTRDGNVCGTCNSF